MLYGHFVTYINILSWDDFGIEQLVFKWSDLGRHAKQSYIW